MAGRIRANPPSLNARALQQLQAASPSADDILGNLGDLNEEIEVQAAAKGIELPQDYAPVEAPAEAVVDDLDAINAKLEAQLAAQQEARVAAAETEDGAPQEVQEELTIEDQVRNMLAECEGAPSERQIAAWKQQYGESGVQVVAMGKGDVYVFTYLRRTAFQKIQQAVAKQAQIEGMQKDPEEFMMEQVLKQCILFPRPLSLEFFYNSRSGVIPTLYSSIMLHSYHLSPQQAMVLTAQL